MTIHEGESINQRLLACYQQALGHELPNQLVALQGLARLLDEELADQLRQPAQGMLRRLAELARRTHEFVTNLAEVGRICRQKQAPVALPFGILCREAAVQASYLSPGQPVAVTIPEDLPILCLPPEATRRVLLELMRFAAQRATSYPVPIRLEASIAEFRLEIQGLPNGLSAGPELFDPFSRTGDGLSNLGLFLARELVEAWGGSLRVERSEDHWTWVVGTASPPPHASESASSG